ncbi:ABC transporter substrate-binding protein [Sulfitobacter alexandrii]|uniref:ABC transporter substrate-binding protein n=1 Tax=Sulfitobacter alexandrii TaxID=1917485 RepID=A0A1J0WM84_9RHOB|nr:substrate-binding protein [Sulfitobacter alexandrii]APE45497.1 ABC transporter substrate-binding protein [Sulfitobacter alexandrii]
MSISRRQMLKSTGAAGVLALGAPSILRAADVINVGVTAPLTGLSAILGETLANCYKLAAAQLNADNGIGGREVNLIIEDNQTSTKGAVDKARKLLFSDNVDVMMGGILSLERTATLSVTGPAKKLYIYPTYYEGGECDPFMIATGGVPNQQIDNYVPWLVENVGKTCYIQGSDYAWAQVSSKIIQEAFEKHGGEVVGVDLFPFGTQDYGPSMQKVREVDPDMVWTMVVGNDAITAVKQYRSFDMKPAYVTQAFDEVFTTSALPDGEAEGMLSAQSYFTTIDSPENNAFVAAYRDMFGENALVNSISEAAYTGFMLYAAAVEQTGGTSDPELVEAITSMTLEAPQGTVSVSPETNIMSTNSIIGRVRADGLFDIVENFGRIKANDPNCSLS